MSLRDKGRKSQQGRYDFCPGLLRGPSLLDDLKNGLMAAPGGSCG